MDLSELYTRFTSYEVNLQELNNHAVSRLANQSY